MSYSRVRYTGNGSQTNFIFSFPYIDQSHVKVRIDGVLTTSFTFLSTSVVQFLSAPPAGSIIEIRRETPKDTPIVNFTDGSVLLERDLDLLALFNLYVSQEAADGVEETISKNSLGNWDAQSVRLTNLAPAEEPTDAVTKGVLDYEYPAVEAVSPYVSQINIVATDLGAPTGLTTDLGLITDPSGSAPGAGTSRIATVADNIVDVQTVANNISAVTGAIASASSAAASATAADASADAAAISATNASASAAAALTSEDAAATSATNAASSASSASTSASTATTKASEAAASATSAASSASSASTSASNASGSATSASSSATNAANSASAAATSATQAATSATSAGTSATNASTSASAAATSASNASASAAAAASSATSAASSSADSALSAGIANEWATKTSGPVAGGEYSAKYYANQVSTNTSAAATSATNAANSATAAASSATAAATSASDAASSAASAAALLDNFDDRYLGSKSSAPTVDNDGNALVIGALYFDTTTGKMRVYTASGWVDASSAAVAALTKYKFTATAGQTTFSGADVNGLTLAYIVGGEVVALNGSVMVGGGDDYTGSNGTSIVLTSGATAGDTLEVYAFSSFSIASVDGSAIVNGTITPDKLVSPFDLGVLP